MEKYGFLPGPVNIRRSTLGCLSRIPIPHRSDEFKETLAAVRHGLCELTHTKESAIFTGSGTLANEIVGAQLMRLGGFGIVLSNGEFGERLAGQAKRFSLNFKHLKYGWGKSFDYEKIESLMKIMNPRWLWFVHFETSTCRLNNLELLVGLSKKYNCKLCVDVISSIANIPLDLSEVYLAAASSGKGLAALAGLGIVFLNRVPKADERLPKYLDLGFNLANGGLPFTISSNHVDALKHELDDMDLSKRISTVAQMGSMIKAVAQEGGVKIIGGENFMMTFELPAHINSVAFGDWFARNNIEVHYKSAYLVERNWIQLALMGYPKIAAIKRFAKLWRDYSAKYLKAV